MSTLPPGVPVHQFCPGLTLLKEITGAHVFLAMADFKNTLQCCLDVATSQIPCCQTKRAMQYLTLPVYFCSLVSLSQLSPQGFCYVRSFKVFNKQLKNKHKPQQLPSGCSTVCPMCYSSPRSSYESHRKRSLVVGTRRRTHSDGRLSTGRV